MTFNLLRNDHLKIVLGLGLLGNLSITLGLLPWLTLSAQGQAVLLETNPTPAAPDFEIPTEVAPAPVYEAPAEPSVAYEPAPAYEPEPVYDAPAVTYEPPVAPVPIEDVPAPIEAPEPYVEAPPYSAPEVAAPPPMPESIQDYPKTATNGCAALLDLNSTKDCAPAAPTAPAVLAADSSTWAEEDVQPVAPTSPVKASAPVATPPARRVTATLPVQEAIPPARQVQSVVPRSTGYQAVGASQPVRPQPVIPSYVPPAPETPGSFTPSALASEIFEAHGLPNQPSPNTPITVVKPNRYGLKPLQSKSALDWILGDQAMLFPMPLPMAVSSAFGWRQHPIQKHWHIHSGIDFAAPEGTPVLAAYDGQVAIADYVGGYGLMTLLSHQGGQRQTRYAHLSQIYVQPGQRVFQGDVIGAVGSTGNSTGPHLHFETLEQTPEGMVVVDPTAEVKSALIRTIDRLQKLAKLRQSQQARKPSSEAINVEPIPVQVLEPMSSYQSSRQLVRTYLAQ